MNTPILIPLHQHEISNPTRAISGAAFLILNLAILFWSGGWGTLNTFESGAGNLFSNPIQNSNNPPENLWVFQSENQENDVGQTITFNPLTPATYGDPVITLSATASSGLPVTFESDNPSVATISGNVLTIVGAGTVNITASQAGDATYDPAPDVDQVLVISKATLTATTDNKTKIYGNPNPALTISYTGFKGSDNVTVIDLPPTVATVATQFSPVDAYDISFMTAGTDNNYSIVQGTEGSLTITKAPLTATADNKTKVYGEPNPSLTISYSGFKGSDDATVIDTPPTLATDVTQFTPADEYSISFITDGTDNNYEITPLTDGILSITKAELTATADNKSRAYGEANPVFTITYTGFIGSDNASGFDTPPLLTTNATLSSPVGSYTISFLNDGLDNNYEISSFTAGTLTINKADQTITFESIVGKTIFDDPFTLPATATSGLPVTFASSNTAVISISGSTATIHGSGTTIITASQAGNTNYNAAVDVTQTVVVNSKKSQTITFIAIPAKSFGISPFQLTATASSDLAVSYTSSNTQVATIAGNTVTLVGVGTTTITASQSGNDMYEAAPDVNQELVVNKGNQTISFGTLATKVFGDPSFDLTATSSAGLPVSYTGSNAAVATIAGSTVTITGVGTATITASQSGNELYEAATNVIQTLVVNKGNQTISFGPIEAKVAGGPAFELTATASSGLPVTYVSSNTGIVTINGNLVTLVAAGSVTITANQSGNDFYTAAEPVSQSFCVNPAKPTITLTNNNSASPVLTSSAPSGNQWYLNGALIPNATNSVLTAITSGVYTVKVKVETCESVASDPVAAIITGDLTQNFMNLDMHPNPVVDQLEVEFSGFETSDIAIAFVDPLGRVVESYVVQNGRKTFNLAHFAPGTYWIQAMQSRHRVTKQFVKK